MEEPYDFVVIGSGFGGSVSAMRLSEKGYRVLVLERGKQFQDEDFARTNWEVWRYLWAPVARCFGIFQISLLKGVMILHGSGVGGGSLMYANVLEVPDDRLFIAPAWRDLADWKSILRPHYETASRMLGVAKNPCLWDADRVLEEIATEWGQEATYRPTHVGIFFGPEGKEVPDPYFGGDGPPRSGCIHCGGCMVGCRHNAKNTLVKNYLHFAVKWGAEILPESIVEDIQPLPPDQMDGARYEVVYRRSTAWFFGSRKRVRARNVVVSAGVLGTLKLLFHCRNISRSLQNLSLKLGEMVRTNSESLLGSISRDGKRDYSKGISIASIFSADEHTRIEPVRYQDGSSFIKVLSVPLLTTPRSFPKRIFYIFANLLRHPKDFLITYVIPSWARRITILLVMQTKDNRMRLKLGRSLFTLFRRGLISEPDEIQPVPAHIDVGQRLTRKFAEKTDGIAASSLGEYLFDIPTTAHILGGCPIGLDRASGVVDLHCRVHGYLGLYVVDGSIMPANPGVNPTLTITALSEYAMSLIPPKS